MAKPVIILAFANEQEAGNRYLRNLPLELNALKRILDRAAEDGLCEVEILPNASLSQVSDTLRKPKYKGRIAIFHYSGHANSLELLLERGEGGAKKAHAAGFVPLLAGIGSLQLVFLNGCYSVQQARGLSEQGVPAVIGTVQAVADELAAGLSVHFYEGLADGLSIDKAWKMATQEAVAGRGEEDWSQYYALEQRGVGLEAVEGRFPWELLYRDPGGETPHWNLPTASESPLFGLPPIPGKYLPPNEPFHFLSRYTKEDAAVFFGRGAAIQSLYRKLVADLGAPVVLLYGQSGAGKSSLLYAGLFPRLETDYKLHYIRRDPNRGMLRQLMEALGIEAAGEELPGEDKEIAQRKIEADIEQLENTLSQLEGGAREQVEGLIRSYREQHGQIGKGMPAIEQSLREKWLEKEAASEKKAMIIIIDQVEEAFTRPNPRLPNELESLLHQIQHIFSDPDKRPQGKVLLSYRKEYHADFLKVLNQFRILKEDFFLDKLDKKGVIEIVTGLESTGQLRQKYQLKVEPGLPIELANNLLSDPDSPIAPVLQIILTKMWQQEKGREKRVFRVADYHKLREEGILLGDFFRQQMEKIKKWEATVGREVVSSGLALDILNFHTTRLGTAESRELEQIRMLYQHQSEVLDQLMEEFRDTYLLANIDARRTALAHDTLAPIVQKEMRDSDRPGQRALRILETKVLDYIKNPEEAIIEEEDLAAVEEGADGMRIWLPMEVELIEKSRQRRAELEAERRRNRIFRVAAVVLIALAAVVSTLLWRQSEQRRQQLAIENQFNEGQLLAETDPSRGLPLILNAYRQDTGSGQKLEAAYRIYEQNVLYETLLKTSHHLNACAFSPDGEYFALATDELTPRVYLHRTSDGSLLDSFTEAKSQAYALAFSPEGDLFIGLAVRNAHRWNVRSGGQDVFFESPAGGEDRPAEALAVSADGAWLLTLDREKTVRLWDARTGAFRQQLSLPAPPLSLASGPGFGLIGLKDGSIYQLDFGSGSLAQATRWDSLPVTALAAGPEGRYLAAGSGQGALQLWRRPGSEGPWQEHRAINGHNSSLQELSFSPDGAFLFSGDGSGRLLATDPANGQVYRELKGHRGQVAGSAYYNNGHFLLSAARDSTVRRWDFPYPLPDHRLKIGPLSIESLAFSPDGGQLFLTDGSSEVHRLAPPFREVETSFSWPEPLSSGLAVSGDGQFLLGGTASGKAFVLEAASGNGIRSAEFFNEPVARIAVAGEWLAAMSASGNIALWRWPSGDAPMPFNGPLPEGLSDIAFAEEGKRLLAGTLDGSLLSWEVPGFEPDEPVKLEKGLQRLSASPSGSVLALTVADSAYLWQDLPGLPQRVPAYGDARWAFGGQAYLSSSGEGCELLLYSAGGFPFQRLWGACARNAFAAHPQGEWYVAGTLDGEAWVWKGLRKPLIK